MLVLTSTTLQSATWAEYLQWRDDSDPKRFQFWFRQGSLWADKMGWEGINHASIADLFTMVLFAWLSQHPDPTLTLIGRCLLEREPDYAVASDWVIYQGSNGQAALWFLQQIQQ